MVRRIIPMSFMSFDLHRGAHRKAGLVAVVLATVAPALAINITFEKVARTGDPAPGRNPPLNVVFNGRAFQTGGNPGVLSRPSINNLGEVVFRGETSAPSDFNLNRAIAIYAWTSGGGVVRLADTTVVSPGVPAFPVPGRPADAIFSNFDPPLVNDRGDVVFWASFSAASGSGSGFYAMTTTGGPIVKLVDTFDPVPGYPATTFNQGFRFGGSPTPLMASLNDEGEVAFSGFFLRTGQQFVDGGLYGTTVAGGTPVRLADSTGVVIPTNETNPFRNIPTNVGAAINNSGHVLFRAAIGSTPGSTSTGMFVVPVDGSAPPTRLALQAQSAPVLSDGAPRSYGSSYGIFDINDVGQYLFHHTFAGTGAPNAVFHGTIPGSAAGVVVDSIPIGAGGYTVPGRPTASFTILQSGQLNESGMTAFQARDNGSFANGQGIYAGDLAASPLRLVANNETVPPGQNAPSRITGFDGRLAVINDAGNVAFAPSTINESLTDSVFGLYFYEDCSSTLRRIVDRDTSAPALSAGLDGTFVAPGCAGNPCERDVRIFNGFETRSGHYRAMNNSNDVAFLVAFSTFNVGIYVAHIESDGGDLAIDCPPDVILQCPADTSPAATGEATADGCGTPSVSYSDEITSGCGETYTIARTWTVASGANSASCVQTIMVVDETAPTISVPADASIECTDSTDPAHTGQATAMDDCDADVTVGYSDTEEPGACPQQRVITRTWTATDDCGNTVTATQVISVGDSSLALLTAPPDITLQCGESIDPAHTGTATAVDACDSDPVVSYSDSIAPGGCAGGATITRTWSAIDACGNVTTAVQLIALIDETPPELTIPANATVECGGATDPAETGSASAIDACDAHPTISYSDSTSAGTCAGEVIIARVWTATDDCGNIATATQIITQTDSTPPTLTLPPDATVECGSSTDPSSTGEAIAFDECDSAPTVSHVDNVEGGSCDQNSTITRTWIATDACGNTSIATQIIEILDTMPPVFSIQPIDLVIECDGDGNVTEINSWLASAAAADSCGGVNISNDYLGVASGCANTGTAIVTFTATDDCGNSSTVSAALTIADTTPPTFTVPPADRTVECDGNGNILELADWLLTAQAADVCGGASVSNDFSAITPACDLTGSTTVTFSAVDECGNTRTQTATFTILDTTAPEVVCPPDLIVDPDPGACTASSLSLGWPIAGDTCSDVVITNDAPASFPVGTTIVTWTVTDQCGHATTCQQAVVVNDSNPPTIECALATTMLWPPNHDLVNVGLAVSVDDACESGIPPIITVYADEDDEMPTGDGNHSPDAKNIATGTLRLRAERRGDANGRVYLIVVEAMDSAGNVGRTACAVVVPHSRSAASINSVASQAAAARQYVLDNGTPPPGFYVVGDGPIIGPKQ